MPVAAPGRASGPEPASKYVGPPVEAQIRGIGEAATVLEKWLSTVKRRSAFGVPPITGASCQIVAQPVHAVRGAGSRTRSRETNTKDSAVNDQRNFRFGYHCLSPLTFSRMLIPVQTYFSSKY